MYKIPAEETFSPLKYRSRRELKMSVIHGAISDLLTPLHANEITPFQARHNSGKIRSCFRIFISYCCDFPEVKIMSAIKQLIAIAMCTRCVRCCTTMTAIRHLECDIHWTLPRMNYSRTMSACRKHSLLTGTHLILSVRQDTLTKMKRSLLRACHHPNGVPFLNKMAYELKQVFQKCTPYSPSKNFINSVLAFQRH